MERVVFRTDFDPYMKMEKYLVVFLDDPHNVGRLPFVSFYFNGDRPVFEPYGEMCFDYYYGKTKRIRKSSDDALRCLRAVEWYYGCQFEVREKLVIK